MLGIPKRTGELITNLAVLAGKQDLQNKSPGRSQSIGLIFMPCRIICSWLLILLIEPVFVGATFDVSHPCWVVQIPLDCLADAGLKSFGWLPAEFFF
jgi:hypothetical protein